MRWVIAAARRLSGALTLLLAAWVVLGQAPAAMAQTVHQYTNTADSATNAISETLTPCAPASSRFARTFTVGTSYVVGDVNIGALLAHTYRGDLVMYLVSPLGTSVQLNTGVTSSPQQANFDALFDDSAASPVTAYAVGATATASTIVPPYASTVRPTSPLSAFIGENAAGTWTLQVCDQYNGDSGTFYQADLYLQEAPATYADLSLAMTVSSATPAPGASLSYTLTVTNAAASPTAAGGITVRDLLPAGLSYSSYSGSGTYASSTGDWAVGSLAPGQSASITIFATVTAANAATVNNTAEITASSVTDIDSTPGNGSTIEDDYAARSITVTRVAGTAPVLTCSAGSGLLDWDTVTWNAGSLTNTIAVSGIGNVGFAITTPGTFLNNATYGGQSPALQNAMTGGLAVPQKSLIELADQANQTDTVTTVITLPAASPGVQFTIFDVDYGAGQFADKVTVTGKNGGTSVVPTLTNGSANYVTGNSAFGDVTSADASGNGNVVVTFASAVDTITIAYGNHALAPGNPGQQAIALHDITLCKPGTLLNVSKTSTAISDPLNGTTGPKQIPGAIVEYCILVSNAGTTTTTSVSANDALPATITYVAGSMKSGTSCAGATTAEDDNATGADESDPFGASITGTTITAITASLAPGAAMAILFRATIN